MRRSFAMSPEAPKIESRIVKPICYVEELAEQPAVDRQHAASLADTA